MTTPEPAPAAPLLGEDARRSGADAFFAAWRSGHDPGQCYAAAFAALEPLVAALVAERERAVYDAAYRELEDVAREFDPDLEGYCIADLARTLRTAMQDRIDDLQAAHKRVLALVTNEDGEPRGPVGRMIHAAFAGAAS